MLVRFGALKTWKRPLPGKVIGPGYHFERFGGKRYLVAQLPGVHENTFQIGFRHYKNHPTQRLNLYPFGSKQSAAKLEWSTDPTCLQVIKITQQDYRHAGLAPVMGNILLRSLIEAGVQLKDLYVDNLLGYPDSSLSMIGLLSKFGINAYRQQDLEKAIEHLRDPETLLDVRSVDEVPQELHLALSIFGGRQQILKDTLKIFLVNQGQNAELHEVLSEDRVEVERLIRCHLAYISLNMQMDPAKATIMEKYAAQLPENQLGR